MLVEFWDFCRPNSLRTLPYVKAWHERYGERGLRVDRRALRRASTPRATSTRCATRWRGWGSSYPVLIDSELRAVAGLRERGLAGALPVRRAARLFELPLRRGRLRGNRARDPGAARRRACEPLDAAAPRGRAGRARSRLRPGPARRLQRPLRGRRRVGACSTARRTVRVNGAPARSPAPGALR